MINLTPPRVDLTLFRGDTTRLTATCTSAATGQPVNLAGATVTLTAKRQLTDADADAVFQVKSADGDITISGNVATIIIAGTLTAPLTAVATLFYDVQVTGGDGPQTVVWGTLTVQLDVTRATG